MSQVTSFWASDELMISRSLSTSPISATFKKSSFFRDEGVEEALSQHEVTDSFEPVSCFLTINDVQVDSSTCRLGHGALLSTSSLLTLKSSVGKDWLWRLTTT